MGEAKRRKQRGEGPRPKLRWRKLDVPLPLPAYVEFKKAHEAYLNRHELKEAEHGERAFAIHLLVIGAKTILAALEKEAQGSKLVLPAAYVPPVWARETSERLQAIKRRDK